MPEILRRLAFFCLVLLALVSVTVAAQQASAVPPVVPASDFVAAPTLTSEQQLRLRVAELQIENAQLRAALAQAQVELLTRETSATLKGLERDGFALSRGEREWQYVPATKEPKR